MTLNKPKNYWQHFFNKSPFSVHITVKLFTLHSSKPKIKSDFVLIQPSFEISPNKIITPILRYSSAQDVFQGQVFVFMRCCWLGSVKQVENNNNNYTWNIFWLIIRSNLSKKLFLGLIQIFNHFLAKTTRFLFVKWASRVLDYVSKEPLISWI